MTQYAFDAEAGLISFGTFKEGLYDWINVYAPKKGYWLTRDPQYGVIMFDTGDEGIGMPADLVKAYFAQPEWNGRFTETSDGNFYVACDAVAQQAHSGDTFPAFTVTLHGRPFRVGAHLLVGYEKTMEDGRIMCASWLQRTTDASLIEIG